MEYFTTALLRWIGSDGIRCEGSVRFIVTNKSGDATVRDLYEEMVKQSMAKFGLTGEPTVVRWTFHPNAPLAPAAV